MSESAAIDIKAKDYAFADENCRVQLFAVTDDILSRLQTEVLDPADDEPDIDGEEGPEGEMEAGEVEEDGLDDGNDGFDDEGVIEIDEIDQKGGSSAKKRNDETISKGKGDKNRSPAKPEASSKTSMDKKGDKKKKLLGIDDEEAKEEKEMLGKISLISKISREK